jgi:hypothetical protein
MPVISNSRQAAHEEEMRRNSVEERPGIELTSLVAAVPFLGTTVLLLPLRQMRTIIRCAAEPNLQNVRPLVQPAEVECPFVKKHCFLL